MEIVLMVVIVISGVIFPICYLIYCRWKKISPSPTMGIIFNIITIILMLYTILAGDKSLQKNTEKTIKALQMSTEKTIKALQVNTNKNIQSLKEEVTRQINSYQEFSNKHITAVKDSTAKEICEMKEIEKRRKLVSLLGLKKEIELNRYIILRIMETKNDILKGAYQTINSFQVSAYTQGMVTNSLTDENLINKILVLYDDLNLANRYIDLGLIAKEPSIVGECMEKMINICEKNKDVCNKIIDELLKIEEKYRQEVTLLKKKE